MEEKKDLQIVIRNEVSELPFHRFLGLNANCFDVEKGRINFDMREELIGNKHFKILHSGVIATIMDIECGFLLALDGAWRAQNEAGPFSTQLVIKGGTIDLRIDYLRPGKGKRFTASGSILRRGNKVAVVRSELRNESDELIAVGTGTYLVG
jgi:uncharacterized protein (TIGR00369 family)